MQVAGLQNPFNSHYVFSVNHASQVSSIAISNDGTRICSGCRDGSIYIWDARTGELAEHLDEVHAGNICSISFSTDGSNIISGSEDCTVCVWDALTGAQERISPLRGHTDSVLSVTFSPDGGRLASGSDDGMLRIWNARLGSVVSLIRHDASVHSVAFLPNGDEVMSACRDDSIRIWDYSGSLLRVVASGYRVGCMSPIAISLDRKLVSVVDSAQARLRIVDTSSGDEKQLHARLD